MDYLRLIIKSLNQIDVKGADNMDRLLGCIQGLERLDKELDKVPEKPEVSKNDNHYEPKQDLHGTVD